MSSPPHDGVFDVGGAAQAAVGVHEGYHCQRGERFLGSIPSPPVNTRSRARFSCSWKACKFRGSSTNDTLSVHILIYLQDRLLITVRNHAFIHRQCPKENCGWDEAKCQSEKDRHVWSKHKAWAEQIGYPSQGAMCDECNQTFSRKDKLTRHKREVHEGRKRR